MLHVGSVPYLVGRPLDLGLGDEAGIDLVHEVPAKLVAGLRDGSLDVALVSSIELFRFPGYRFLDGLGVAGHSEVSSVQVFLRRPIDSVQRLALDPSSRTAQALTRTLWPNPSTQFLELEPGEDPRDASADAWLRIGDPALRDLEREPDRPRWNPSAAWRRATELPFIFAPWIVRSGVRIEPHLDAFRRAAEAGAGALEALAHGAAAGEPAREAFLLRYLRDECTFRPGPDMQASLFEFRDRASIHGLCDADARPAPVPIPPI
ncbi:MAG TPA: hypothetical protein ENJ09_06250 [Planctomycetes bacterium]|nr:hypothetical protein [Planctomycetota bacterium]